MIDHLLRFPDEATAIAALSRFRTGEGKDAGWETSRCIPDTKVFRVTGTTTDAEGNVSETRQYAPGWFIQIGLPSEDQILNKRAAATIINRETKQQTKIDVAISAGWQISPVFAGA